MDKDRCINCMNRENCACPVGTFEQIMGAKDSKGNPCMMVKVRRKCACLCSAISYLMQNMLDFELIGSCHMYLKCTASKLCIETFWQTVLTQSLAPDGSIKWTAATPLRIPDLLKDAIEEVEIGE